MTEPVPARFYSGHFTFADGIFAEEVQHDPTFYFHGEEITIAVRAYTHGYDSFHPHKILAWHEYTRKEELNNGMMILHGVKEIALHMRKHVSC